MRLFPIFYKVDKGLYTIVFVNTGTLRVLIETDNKQGALDKQDDRHHGGFSPEECLGLWFMQPESLEEQYIRKERQQEVRNALRCLSATQLRRIHAYCFEGLTTYEIARVEGKSQPVIARSIQKGLAKIKKFLQQGYQKEF